MDEYERMKQQLANKNHQHREYKEKLKKEIHALRLENAELKKLLEASTGKGWVV
jgi:regulator of replication initiation timing